MSNSTVVGRETISQSEIVETSGNSSVPMRRPDGKLVKGGPTLNPRGRGAAMPKDLREAARAHTDEALAVVLEAIRDRKLAMKVRLQAVNILLDRGYGKPVQSVEADVRTLNLHESHLKALLDGNGVSSGTVIDHEPA
ncbi:hypothetical protein [Enterovirga aerilata]|uniref:DUF5681 domain-containing protein n=1 Tax=Enterovirga aerilata TaxID=2730920 RepID=A0A849I5M4_9HYPH|nr:hypothetical protein [Enterovirga sp. DB1703]NNM74762.1 hypothetical protein [Enterovirga sp. DB1703]